MATPRGHHLLFTILLLALFSVPLRAEEEDVELALEPPDAAEESQMKEQLEEVEGQSREIAEGPEGDTPTAEEGDAAQKTESEANVPQINDNVYESRAGTEQMKLLRYHRQIMADRDAVASSGDEEPPLTFHLAAGFHFGVSSVSNNQFNADFQVTVSRHFTLGAYGNFSSQSALGAFAVNYYSRQPYDGIWVQFGVGYEQFKVGAVNVFSDATIASTSPIVLDVGWRWLGSNNLSFGFGAGINGYFFVPQPAVQFNVKLQLGLGWNIFPH